MNCQVIVFALILGLALALPHKAHKSLLTRKTRGVNGGLGIYKGKATTIEKHPYLVGILADDTFECAGVIVSSSYVLTLADCVYGGSASEFTVVAGSSDGSTGTSFSVKKLIVNPSYEEELDYDFALLKISGTFTWGSTIANVSLPTAAPATGTALIVSGWGDTSAVASDSTTLYQGKMSTISESTCESDYSDYDVTFTDRMGCAYNKGKTTCCSNDFGDPFVKGDTLYGLFAAAGTTGFCTSSAIPVIFADVSSVLTWIEKYV